MKKLFLSLLVLFFSSQCFALFCPASLREIQYGDTIEHITQLCGKPESQGTYAEYVADEEDAADDQVSAQDTADSNDDDDADQKTVVITKFIYGKPHPTVLIFENGKLSSRQSRDTGAIFMYDNHHSIIKSGQKRLA